MPAPARARAGSRIVVDARIARAEIVAVGFAALEVTNTPIDDEQILDVV
jgi:hypothetical protein